MINNLLKISLFIVGGLEVVTAILICICLLAMESFMVKMRAKKPNLMTRKEKTLVKAVLDDNIMRFIRKYFFKRWVMTVTVVVVAKGFHS